MRFQSTQSSQTVTQQLGGISIGWIISIHTVLADCDSTSTLYALPSNKFQSTQSSQTVTLLHVDIRTKEWDFNPHSPRRLWRRRWLRWHRHSNISIHTVLADCDLENLSDGTPDCYFNPHSPRRLWQTDLHQDQNIRRFQSTQSSQTVTRISQCV